MNNFYLSQQLGRLLLERNLHLAVAESCTAGGLAAEITAVSHSSKWFERGFITYSDDSKVELLGVDPDTLALHGAVSEKTAKEMAIGALKQSNADISLSITGIAGPTGGSKEKPVGLVYFGLAELNGQSSIRKAQFFSGRKHVRDCAIHFALQWLIEHLK